MHSFLAGAEVELDNANRYSWLDYICQSIHNNASDVPALVQDGYEPGNEYLDALFQAVQNIDIFAYHYYPLDYGTPTSGAVFQNHIQHHALAAHYAATQLQTYLSDVPLHFYSQAHVHPGVYRLPSAEEILCQNNISLAYGAKGIVYYLYASLNGGINGLVTLARNTTTQYNNISSLHDDYQNTGKTFFEIGFEFMELTWMAGYSIHQETSEPIDGTYDLYDVQSNALGYGTDDPGETYVEVGILQDASNVNHYMVVNRRCVAEREITITFESTSNHAYLITDIFLDREIRFLPLVERLFPTPSHSEKAKASY